MDFLKSEQGAVSHFVKIKYVDKKLKKKSLSRFFNFLRRNNFASPTNIMN